MFQFPSEWRMTNLHPALSHSFLISAQLSAVSHLSAVSTSAACDSGFLLWVNLVTAILSTQTVTYL